MKKLYTILLLFVCSVTYWVSGVAETLESFHPYENDKIYLGFGFGSRILKYQEFNTAIPHDKFISNTETKLTEQIILGYDLHNYLGFEMQFTFFPSWVYFLTPRSDSILRKIYAFSGLLKFMIPMNRMRLYFGGGGSVVYTLAPNFEVYVPNGQYAPPDGSNYIDGKWGHQDFFRPELFVGVGYYVSKRILISVVYSNIFGVGTFNSHLETFKTKDPEFFVNKNYLPDLELIVLMITMKI